MTNNRRYVIINIENEREVKIMREVVYKVTKPGRVGFAKRKTLEHAHRTAQDIHFF